MHTSDSASDTRHSRNVPRIWSRLSGRPRRPHGKLRILHDWAESAGRESSIFDVPRWSSTCLHSIALLMLGELPVNRVRAHFADRKALGNLCNSRFCKRACLYCLHVGDTLVMDSEWHWVFDCPHFQELRMGLPVLSRCLDSCRNTDRGFATPSNLMSLLKMVQIQYHIGVSLGSFIKRAITSRETWTSGGGPPAALLRRWKKSSLS